MDGSERDRLLLEEQYPDGAVATGFIFRYEIVSEPVQRVLFEVANRNGNVLLRLWFELDEFAQFSEMTEQVAMDAGCYEEHPQPD